MNSNEKLKQKLESIDRKRARNKEKKLAKKIKAQESNEIKQKEFKAAAKIEKQIEIIEPQVPLKKKKSVLTAFEAKSMIMQTIEQNGKHTKEKVECNVDQIKSTKTESKVMKMLNEAESSEKIAIKKDHKKKTEKLETNKENRLLKIFNGFSEVPVTPESTKLKKNRGFHEVPLTPRPIGFKVSSILPSDQEYIQRKTKKRKRGSTERDIIEPSRVLPKPVWSASGKFEEIDAGTGYIALNANTNTDFKLSVLQQPPAKKRHVEPLKQNGLSSFKHKALYESKLSVRQTTKDLLRQVEKQKLLKKGKNY